MGIQLSDHHLPDTHRPSELIGHTGLERPEEQQEIHMFLFNEIPWVHPQSEAGVRGTQQGSLRPRLPNSIQMIDSC